MFVTATASQFHPTITFVVKAGAYLCGAPCYTSLYGQAPGMALPTTITQVQDIEKHSSLLRYEINYNSKKFYGTGKKLFFNAETEKCIDATKAGLSADNLISNLLL